MTPYPIEFILQSTFATLKASDFKQIETITLLNQILPKYLEILETITYPPSLGILLNIFQLLIRQAPLPIFLDNDFLVKLLTCCLTLLTKFGRSDQNSVKTGTGTELSAEVFKLIAYLLETLPEDGNNSDSRPFFLTKYEISVIMRYSTEDLLNKKMSRKQNAFKILGILLDKRVDKFLRKTEQLNLENKNQQNGDDQLEEDLSVKNFHDIFKEVLELAINSNLEIVRNQSKKLFIRYINIEHIIRLKHINNYMAILLDNSNFFKLDSGRITAAEILAEMPEKCYIQNESLLFTVSSMLVKSFGQNLLINEINAFTVAEKILVRFCQINNLNDPQSKFFNRFFEIIKLWLGYDDVEARQGQKVACVTLGSIFAISNFYQDNPRFLKTKTCNNIIEFLTNSERINPESSSIVFKNFVNQSNPNLLDKLSHPTQKTIENWFRENFAKLANSSDEIIKKNASIILMNYFRRQNFSIIDGHENNGAILFDTLLNDDSAEIRMMILKCSIMLARKSLDNLYLTVDKMVQRAKYESSNNSSMTVSRCDFMEFCCGILIGNAELVHQIHQAFDGFDFSSKNESGKSPSTLTSTILKIFDPLSKELSNIEQTQTSDKLKEKTQITVDFLKSNNCLTAQLFSQILSKVQADKQIRKRTAEVERAIQEKNTPGLMEKRKQKRNEKVLKRRNVKKREANKVEIKRQKRTFEQLLDM